MPARRAARVPRFRTRARRRARALAAALRAGRAAGGLRQPPFAIDASAALVVSGRAPRAQSRLDDRAHAHARARGLDGRRLDLLPTPPHSSPPGTPHLPRPPACPCPATAHTKPGRVPFQARPPPARAAHATHPRGPGAPRRGPLCHYLHRTPPPQRPPASPRPHPQRSAFFLRPPRRPCPIRVARVTSSAAPLRPAQRLPSPAWLALTHWAPSVRVPLWGSPASSPRRPAPRRTLWLEPVALAPDESCSDPSRAGAADGPGAGPRPAARTNPHAPGGRAAVHSTAARPAGGHQNARAPLNIALRGLGTVSTTPLPLFLSHCRRVRRPSPSRPPSQRRHSRGPCPGAGSIPPAASLCGPPHCMAAANLL
jgi:hypothetical protein